MFQKIFASVILLSFFLNACGQENGVSGTGETESRLLSIRLAPGPGITDLTRKQGYWTAPAGACSVTVAAFDSLQGIQGVALYRGRICLGRSVTSPHVFNISIPENSSEPFLVQAFATNAVGQTLFTAPLEIRSYSRSKNGPEMHRNGSCTFRIEPGRLLPEAVGRNIYLAGDMNEWGGYDRIYRKRNMLTNRGDGVFTLTVTNVLPGDEYKFNIDYDGDGMRDDTRDWNMDPANPANLTNWVGTENSIIPFPAEINVK